MVCITSRGILYPSALVGAHFILGQTWQMSNLIQQLWQLLTPSLFPFISGADKRRYVPIAGLLLYLSNTPWYHFYLTRAARNQVPHVCPGPFRCPKCDFCAHMIDHLEPGACPKLGKLHELCFKTLQMLKRVTATIPTSYGIFFGCYKIGLGTLFASSLVLNKSH